MLTLLGRLRQLPRSVFFLFIAIVLVLISSIPILGGAQASSSPIANATTPQATYSVQSPTPRPTSTATPTTRPQRSPLPHPTPSPTTQSPHPSHTTPTPVATATPAPGSTLVPTPTPTSPPVSQAIPTPTPHPTPKPTQKPTPTPTPTPPPPGWKPLLVQGAPGCSSPTGTSWTIPHPDTTRFECSGSGTLMQQLSSAVFAEADLGTVQGSNYNQNTFRFQVQARFYNTGDTATAAAVIFQTPLVGCGGFIFTLNPSGHWELQQVASCTSIPTIASGTIGINPAGFTAITILNQYNTLAIFINGQAVISGYGDGLNPTPGECGLMVERRGGTSSVVEYAAVELDTWR